MKKLQVKGETILNLPEGDQPHATIIACETEADYLTWCRSGGMACCYKSQVYVKVPQHLSEEGEFSLNFDCLLLKEANQRIEEWNRQDSGQATKQAALSV